MFSTCKGLKDGFPADWPQHGAPAGDTEKAQDLRSLEVPTIENVKQHPL